MAVEEEEGEKRVDARFTESCFLMDYIDVISEFGRNKNGEGYKNFKVVECSPDAGGGAHEIISKLTLAIKAVFFANFNSKLCLCP